jgi:mesencephalic astrocyte-derived neurotrophic factor
MVPSDFFESKLSYALISHTASFVAPAVFFSLSLSTLSTITVCVKVMDDVRASMDKDDSRKKDKVEAALGKYCGIIPGHDNNPGANLSARERKICYYIDPIKRDVAQPFSLGMSSLKVCQRINKSNPEICSVKFPVKTEKMEAKDITKLRVKQLKQILAQRGVECKGCVEKEEFVKKVQETEHLAADEF